MKVGGLAPALALAALAAAGSSTQAVRSSTNTMPPPLTTRQAHSAARMAAKPLVDLLDAKTMHFTGCTRRRANRIDCTARINGAQQTCQLRLPVIRDVHFYVISARDLACATRQ